MDETKVWIALVMTFIVGVPAVFLVAGSLASVVACGGVACRMSDTTYHQVAFPMAIMFMFIGGAVLGAVLGWIVAR